MADDEVQAEPIPEATFEDIIAAYEEAEGEFEYVVGEGEKARRYRAKRVTNLSEKIALSESAESFEKHCNRIAKTDAAKLSGVERGWKPYLSVPLSRKTAVFIVFVSRLLIAPKLSQLQCLKLAATCGDALLDIAVPLLGKVTEDVTTGEVEEIEATKND